MKSLAVGGPGVVPIAGARSIAPLNPNSPWCRRRTSLAPCGSTIRNMSAQGTAIPSCLARLFRTHRQGIVHGRRSSVAPYRHSSGTGFRQLFLTAFVIVGLRHRRAAIFHRSANVAGRSHRRLQRSRKRLYIAGTISVLRDFFHLRLATRNSCAPKCSSSRCSQRFAAW